LYPASSTLGVAVIKLGYHLVQESYLLPFISIVKRIEIKYP